MTFNYRWILTYIEAKWKRLLLIGNIIAIICGLMDANFFLEW